MPLKMAGGATVRPQWITERNSITVTLTDATIDVVHLI